MKIEEHEYIKDRVFKRFFGYMLFESFGELVVKKTKELQQAKREGNLNLFLTTCKTDILILMHKKNVPQHWFQTFYDLILKGEINLPLHEGMALYIDDYQINKGKIDEERVKKSKVKELTIKLTGNVSQSQIIEFVRLNADFIKRLEDILNLPEIKYERLDIIEAFDLFAMSKKGVGDLSYGDIKKLYKEKNPKSKVRRDSVKTEVKRYTKIINNS